MTTQTIDANRQGYFELLAEREAGASAFKLAPVRIQTGPISGYRQDNRILGYKLIDAKHSEDGTFEAFVSPRIRSGQEAAIVVMRILIHATLGMDVARKELKAAFDKAGVGLGEGGIKPTTIRRLNALVARMPFKLESVHAPSNEPPVQSTRNLKFACSQECGWSFRLSEKMAANHEDNLWCHECDAPMEKVS